MPPEIMHKPQQSERAAQPETVLLAGRFIHLLPGRQGVVGSGAAAVNEAWAAAARPSMARRLWRGLALLWAPRHRLVMLHADYGVHRGQPPQRWPSTWPYADFGMGPRCSDMALSGSDLPADAIVDRDGRILRL